MNSYREPDEDTDLILSSSDNVKLYVSSVVLKMSSTVFRDMLKIGRPQARIGSEDSATTTVAASTTPPPTPKSSALPIDEAEPVDLSERADVLESLLDTIYPSRDFSVGPQGLAHLKLVGQAAHKYDMDAAQKVIRTFLLSRSTVEGYSEIELYGVAWDLGFVEEAKALSTETLRCNLHSMQNQAILEKMDITAVMKLIRLHHRRKVIMMNSLTKLVDWKPYYADAAANYGVAPEEVLPEVPEFLTVPYKLTALHCDDFPRSTRAWLMLMSEVLKTMEERSDGHNFFKEELEFFHRQTFAELKDIIDRRMLARAFRIVIDRMPKVVDI